MAKGDAGTCSWCVQLHEGNTQASSIDFIVNMVYSSPYLRSWVSQYCTITTILVVKIHVFEVMYTLCIIYIYTLNHGIWPKWKGKGIRGGMGREGGREGGGGGVLQQGCHKMRVSKA